MSTYGIKAWDAQGNLTFDSSVDLVLFPKTEQFISGNNQVGQAGLTLSFPQYQGKKIMPFMTSPYGSYYVDGSGGNNTPIPAVLSCRVSYPNGTPTVFIYGDTVKDAFGQSVPLYDGYLVVMLTGSSQ